MNFPHQVINLFKLCFLILLLPLVQLYGPYILVCLLDYSSLSVGPEGLLALEVTVKQGEVPAFSSSDISSER